MKTERRIGMEIEFENIEMKTSVKRASEAAVTHANQLSFTGKTGNDKTKQNLIKYSARSAQLD